MTDYPSIKPEDVREGDVVRWTAQHPDQPVTMQGTVWLDENGRRWVGPFTFERRDLVVPDLRLVSRPTPPEPPLRVGDWVRHTSGVESQLTPDHTIAACTSQGCARIEPPVGWPVGVPDPDAPGGVEWYRCTGGDEYYVGSCSGVLSWSELLAAGGVPAQAVTR